MLKTNQIANSNTGFAAGLFFMLKTVAISYIISILLIFVAALVATYQAMSDMGICVMANIVTALGTIFAGFMAGRHFDSKGILYGAGCGIIYSIILCIIGNIVSAGFSMGMSFVTALIIGTLCGAVGGIAGINTKHQRRR